MKPTLHRMARPVPTLDYERELMATGARIIAGMDEVGRGAIAGPVPLGAGPFFWGGLRLGRCPAPQSFLHHGGRQ